MPVIVLAIETTTTKSTIVFVCVCVFCKNERAAGWEFTKLLNANS